MIEHDLADEGHDLRAGCAWCAALVDPAGESRRVAARLAPWSGPRRRHTLPDEPQWTRKRAAERARAAASQVGCLESSDELET